MQTRLNEGRIANTSPKYRVTLVWVELDGGAGAQAGELGDCIRNLKVQEPWSEKCGLQVANKCLVWLIQRARTTRDRKRERKERPTARRARHTEARPKHATMRLNTTGNETLRNVRQRRQGRRITEGESEPRLQKERRRTDWLPYGDATEGRTRRYGKERGREITRGSRRQSGRTTERGLQDERDWSCGWQRTMNDDFGRSWWRVYTSLPF